MDADSSRVCENRNHGKDDRQHVHPVYYCADATLRQDNALKYRRGTTESGEEGRTGRPAAAASRQVPSPSGYLAEALDLTSARRERVCKEVGRRVPRG